MREYTQPISQRSLSFYTGRTELRWNEVLFTWYDEDGRNICIGYTRQMFIDHQHDTYNDFQDWYLDELMADYME